MNALKAAAVVLAALVAAPAAAPGEGAAGLRVHLPRTVTTDAPALQLGMISVVRADDKAIERLAAAIPMGRAPWTKEGLVIDRPTILGRLATHGIDRAAVTLSGADCVVITRRETAVQSAEVVRAAEAFLRETRPAPKGCTWRLGREPAELMAMAGGQVTLKPRLLAHAVDGEARVEVAAVVDGQKVAVAEMTFRLSYPRHQLVATEEIPPDGVITPANTKIRTVTDGRPQPQTWVPPYGQLALRPIRTGEVVSEALVRPSRPKLVVRRNDSVIMRIVGELFQVTDIGQALEDGHQGNLIRVRNAGSKRVIVARVMADGVVEPVFNGVKR
ncbi:MAG TPA: flagellar basal body P-ring formation chaperone FlgA [Phycisphaerae bacterium]|nr:flagellar basal body P-ring formation chaperone FlgA [Phycisphaerae bacterium]